jgi:hypothetical protein
MMVLSSIMMTSGIAWHKMALALIDTRQGFGSVSTVLV